MKHLLKCKRSQGVFGMSFGVIFSIIIIVFFLVAAFMAIKFFLGFQRQAEAGMFLEDLQAEIDVAWNSQSSSIPFQSSLPSGITDVCFINMSAVPSANAGYYEKQIYSEVKFGNYDINFVLYPVGKAGGLSHSQLEHFQMPEKNPYCISVSEGVVEINIDKDFGEALPRVS